MDPLVKCLCLTLTKNGFSTFPGLISFVVWELKNCKGISVGIVILGFGVGKLYGDIGTVSIL